MNNKNKQQADSQIRSINNSTYCRTEDVMCESSNYFTTPYDDVYHTMVSECKKLTIPVINEVFNRTYTENAKIILNPNEIYLRGENGSTDKRITDSLITVEDDSKKDNFHIECESTADGSIILRIYEYDSQIGFLASELKNGVLEVNFPHSAILYLRSHKSTPDFVTIKINTSGGSVSYDVKVIKVKSYSIKDIFDKKLLFLIPFYIFTYENDFNKIENDADKLKSLKETFADIRKTLDDMCLSGEIDEYTKCTICEMCERVINNIARNHDKIKKEVTDIMGGKVLDYEARNILIRGKNEGIVIGRGEGIVIGRGEGIPKGENKLATLIKTLKADNRQEDADNVLDDEDLRNQLYKEYGIVD